MPADEPKKKGKNQAFLEQAKSRFKMCSEAEADLRKDALDDLKFSIGEQWPPEVESQRALDKRPCLTVNRLTQSIRLVTNEQRQQRPAIQVNPVGDGADVEGAEIRQGIIRHIEVRSDAEVAYDTSYDQMVRTGFGYFRILTEYAGDDTLNQEIRIKRIKNQFKVYFDPTTEEFDYSDARFAFIIEDVPIDDFKNDYPNASFASLSDFTSIGDNPLRPINDKTIRVAEYFYVSEDTKTLHVMADGSVQTELKAGETAKETRERKKKVIKWARITALESLEEETLLGKYIPIVPVLGEDVDNDGKRYLAGLVRAAKDPQRAYNYWKTAATETIALAPKAPWIIAEGQIENHEEEWRQSNTKNFVYLPYKPIDVAGRQVPPPQRNAAGAQIGPFSEMLAGAAEDLQATTGIYNPSLGKTEGDQSGKAVLARQKQSDVSVLNFSDNFARSIRHAGRIILDLMPKIYDTARIMRIIMPDEQKKLIIVHSGADEAEAAKQLAIDQQMKKVYDLSAGEYDVAVSVGPSYQSKRQEAVASQMALIGAWPDGMQVFGDLLVANMDWPQAQEIAKRIKLTLPPQLQQGDDDDPAAMLQQRTAQLNQIMQQHDNLVNALNAANEMIRTKQIEGATKAQIEANNRNSDQVIAKMKIEAQIAVAEIEAKAQNAFQRAKLEMDMWNNLHDAAHETALSTQEHNQTLDQQSQAADQGLVAQQAAAQAQPNGAQAGQ